MDSYYFPFFFSSILADRLNQTTILDIESTYLGGKLVNSESLPDKRYIGECIYCGSTENLTDEHIVPHGLSGKWQLLEGSCQDCAKITSRFEESVLRKQLILPRTALSLPTYHPKKRPKNFSFDKRISLHKQSF